MIGYFILTSEFDNIFVIDVSTVYPFMASHVKMSVGHQV